MYKVLNKHKERIACVENDVFTHYSPGAFIRDLFALDSERRVCFRGTDDDELRGIPTDHQIRYLWYIVAYDDDGIPNHLGWIVNT